MAVGVTSSSQIQNWVIGDREVILSRYPTAANYLKYSIREKGFLSEKTFEVTRYEMSFALKLVKIFRDVIARRLEMRSIDQSSFLPIVCVEALKCREGGKYTSLQGLKVALFGTLDLVQERVENIAWAIFDETREHVVSTHPQAANEILKHFFCNAPRYDRLHEDKKRNYEMSTYAKHFRAVAHYDRFDEPREVELRRCSLLDRDVFLDENHWAITLVSTRDAFDSFFEKLFRSEIGHALIACEGVREGFYFLTYIHFTQRPRPTNPPSFLLKNEGQVEIFDKEVPLDTENGPVWPRSRVLVDNMLNFAKNRVGQPAKFALYGSSLFISLQFFKLASSLIIIKNIERPENAFIKHADLFINRICDSKIYCRMPLTCLEMALLTLTLGGVILNRTAPMRTPIAKIKILRMAPSYNIPDTVDRSYILERKLFPSQYQEMVKTILNACVVLIPNNSNPKEAAFWVQQVLMEGIELRRFLLASSSKVKPYKLDLPVW